MVNSTAKVVIEYIRFIFIMVCRLLLGIVFLFSGTAKAIDPAGTAIKVGEYFTAFGLKDLQWLALPFSVNLSAIEFTLGVCMLLGVYRRYASFLTMLMMIFMTPLTLYLALNNPVPDCGCFGDVLLLSNWQTFYKNIVLLAASVVAFIYNQRTVALYTFKTYWIVALFSYVYCICFSMVNYWHLPIVDFRPFRVGVNISEQMAVPEGAPQDEYEYTFVYEKDGKQKMFSLENAPAADSTWTFVSSESKLIRKGYVPPISDFLVLTLSGDDMTETLLTDTTATFLLIAPNLEQASDERIDEINNVYDYAQDKRMRFYCLTGSDEEAINQWIDYTGAEYPFLFVDEVTLKTMIRSNPGMVLLKHGTILSKWHYKDIPDEQHIDAAVSKILKHSSSDKKRLRIITNLLTFTVPLLLFWIIDYSRNRRTRFSRKRLEDSET